MGCQQKNQQTRSSADIHRIRELEETVRKASHYLKLLSELLSLLSDDLDDCELPF